MAAPGELDALKAALVAAWDLPFQRPEPDWDGARMETLAAPLPPHGGLAIGHSIDPATKAVQLELRLTASGGPDLTRAEALVKEAKLQGVEAIIRRFLHAPALPRGHAPAQAVAFGGLRRPLHVGSSVAHELGFAGTLGAFVEFADGRQGLLSCAHVLAEAPRASIKKGDFIQQPGQPEPIPPLNRIGALSEYFSRFVPARTDNIDAAIAELAEGIEIHGNVMPVCDEVPEPYRGRPFGPPLTRDEVELGTRVVKLGRTSGFTEGLLSAADFMNFRPRLAGRKAITFGRVHEVAWDEDGAKPFTEPGDSGSMILTADTLRPIGIHFCAVPLADGGHRSYMIPWDRIAEHFPMRLL